MTNTDVITSNLLCYLESYLAFATLFYQYNTLNHVIFLGKNYT